MATQAVVIPVARQRFFTLDGSAPLSGGLLYSYLSGTSTPQALYADEALTIPLANPVELDADGYAPALYTAPVALKLVLTDASGALQWTQDQIVPPNLFTGTIATPTAFGHSIGGAAPSDPEAVALAFVGTFTPPSTTTTATMLGINPNPLDLSAATSVATVSIEAVSGTMVLPATASGSLSLAALRITAPSVTSLGATAAAAATVQVTGAMANASLSWGLQVSGGDARFRQAVTMDGVLTPAQITTNQNDYAPIGIDACTLLRLSTDASRQITGLNAILGSRGATQINGRLLLVKNVGANDLVLVHESGSSTAAYRFNLPGAGNLTLNPSDMVILFYDGTATRWAAVGV